MRTGFTLVELLICIGVLALLAGLLAPALRGGREAARKAACLANLRQLGIAWQLYADAGGGRSMPVSDVWPGVGAGGGEAYWWGRVVTTSATAPAFVDHAAGFIAPHLSAALSERSVFECPSQRWGTYRAQPMSIPAPGVPTSTYGYNGYGLCPPATPGWGGAAGPIGAQAWKRIDDLERPADQFVFADSMLPTGPLRNSALLDPPMLYDGQGSWSANPFPTTSFRHGQGSAATGRADGSARPIAARPEWLTHPEHRVGSAGAQNGPHYVQDWERWR